MIDPVTRACVVAIFIALAACVACAPARATEIVLTGTSLTLEQVVEIARHGGTIAIAPAAQRLVERGFQVVLDAALQNLPVYGLTLGVGWNKDRPVFHEVGGKRVLSPALLDRSRRFNLDSLRAHAAGIGEVMAPEAVRAGMVIRLNTLLSGAAGVHPAVVEQYVAFLNAGIVPVVPSRGTVGEADITLAAHVGLVMAGEWDAIYRGQRLGAAAALRAAGLAPLQPVGKDFLAILSTNAVVAGEAVLALDAAARYLDRQTVLSALALEGFNGNVAPFLAITTQARPYPGMVSAAADVRALLAGSSLWQPSPDRALQDPLSYRTMAYTLGNVLEAIEEARRVLAIQINHSDDNPLVALAPSGEVHAAAGQVRGYVVPGEVPGAIYPTANFESLPFVAAVERLSLALAKLSQALTMTILRLENPELTRLPRFLAAPGNAGHAFGAVQKSCAALNAENRTLAMPVSLDTPTLAGTLEDTATNSQLAVANLRRIVANLYQIASLQLLHAAQAVDLRPGFALGAGTRPLHAAYRRLVPFVQEDRIFTRDIACGAQFLQTWHRQQAEVELSALPACAR